MREFSKETRQEILQGHIDKFGRFEAREFLRDVRSSNGTHPAWSWFEWNDGQAAEEHRVWQARMFVQGLRVRVEVEETRSRKMSVQVRELPAYISPVEDRQAGGGYTQVDPNDPEHRQEILRQARRSLQNFLERYGDALELEGITTAGLRKALATLEQVAPKKEAAA